MKIKPIEQWIGDEPATSYVAIRADEANRKGYMSTKGNIETKFPFIDAGIDHDGYENLDDAGIGLPPTTNGELGRAVIFASINEKLNGLDSLNGIQNFSKKP